MARFASLDEDKLQLQRLFDESFKAGDTDMPLETIHTIHMFALVACLLFMKV